jgi:hypothetical protein
VGLGMGVLGLSLGVVGAVEMVCLGCRSRCRWRLGRWLRRTSAHLLRRWVCVLGWRGAAWAA